MFNGKGACMFKKRKKFKEEITSEKRLSDRWDQQVFFITNKFPQSNSSIKELVKDHELKQGNTFVPSEDALEDLAKLCHEFRGLT
jgi:hypothetical protein